MRDAGTSDDPHPTRGPSATQPVHSDSSSYWRRIPPYLCISPQIHPQDVNVFSCCIYKCSRRRMESRRRNQKLMINIVGFFSRYTYHSLLVVQGCISIAYWSSQPSVPQHTTTPPGPPLLPRCVFLLGLAAFGSVRSYIFDYTARRAIA